MQIDNIQISNYKQTNHKCTNNEITYHKSTNNKNTFINHEQSKSCNLVANIKRPILDFSLLTI